MDRHSKRSGLTASSDLQGVPLKRYRDTNHYIRALSILSEADRVDRNLNNCSLVGRLGGGASGAGPALEGRQPESTALVALRRFGTGWIAARRPRSAAWTGRRCATGSIASTPPDRMGSSTIGRTVPGPVCRPSNWPSLPSWSRLAPIARRTASCVGAGWTSSVIAERFGVEFHERYVGKLLKKLGFSHMSVRPRHPGQDERIVEAFKTYGPPRRKGFVEIGG